MAFEVVKIIHGEEKANEAKMMSEVLFTDEFSKLTEKEMLEIFEKAMVDVKENSKLEDILIDGKVCDSKREARQLITGNSISLNNKKVTDPNFIVNKEDTLLGKYIVLKKGKKYFFLLRFAE